MCQQICYQRTIAGRVVTVVGKFILRRGQGGIEIFVVVERFVIFVRILSMRTNCTTTVVDVVVIVVKMQDVIRSICCHLVVVVAWWYGYLSWFLASRCCLDRYFSVCDGDT